jgi:tetratricopeptide (TPR) repeat protein
MATYDAAFIIRYVEDELTEAEKRQFEADLLTDPSLATQLSLYYEIKATLQLRLPQDAAGEALRSTLSDLNKSHFAHPAGQAQPVDSASPPGAFRTIPSGAARTRRPVFRIAWITAAAAAACIIAVVGLLILPSRHNEDAFDRLGHTEMVSTTERGGNADSLLQQAAMFFNRQEFSRALPLLDKAVRTDSSSQLALFYRGVASWHTGAIDSARQDLGRVYNGESILRYEAAFYMALSYASQKNRAAAKEWLKRIPEGTPASNRARELEIMLK